MSGGFLNFAASFQGRLAALLCCLTAAFIRPSFRPAAAGGFQRLLAFAPAAFVLLALALPQAHAYDNHNISTRIFSISGNSPPEGDSTTATIRVHDDSNLYYPISIDVWTENKTHGGYDQASNSDYTPISYANRTVRTFTKQSDAITVTINTTEDQKVEGDERFRIWVQVSGNKDVNAKDGVYVKIRNDDYATVSLSAQSASEGDSMTFTATHSGNVGGFGYTLTPSYTNGTAASTDYSGSTTALSFAGTTGESKTFTVSTTEDAVVEHNETFTAGLTLTTSGLPKTDGAALVTVTGATGTINNDDSAAVTINNAQNFESDGVNSRTIDFTVTLSEAVQGGLKVTPSYTNGTAASTDYTANTTALSFSGTKGETKTLKVATAHDTVVEYHETFTVGLSVSDAPSGVTSTDTGTGQVNDDDSATVTVNDADADEGDAMTFTATLSGAVQGGLTVTPSYTNGTAASTDYTANTTALDFTGTHGETKTFSVSTLPDSLVETDETFTVGLSVSKAPSARVTARDTGTGTINDDDSARVTIDDASADEGNQITFTVELDGAVPGGLTVTPSYTNGTASSADYTENTTALNFTGTNHETKSFRVSTKPDTTVEAAETFTVGLSVSGTSASVIATDTGTGTINDDDSPELTINNASASEGDSMTFTVTLDAAVSGGLTVTPSYTNGTAASTDYSTNTTGLSFNGTAGETKTFAVSTTEDAVVERNETFTVGLGVSGTTEVVRSTDTGTGTINNDDSATVTINDASADEAKSMTFTVKLDKAVQGGFKITPHYTNGTAADTDYGINTPDLSFTGTANETKTFDVYTNQDDLLEADETFTVALRSTSAPPGVTYRDTGTGTIVDDDSAKLTVNDASASEGDAMTFTVTLDKDVPGGLKVKPSYTNGTAAGTDYTTNTTKVDFSGTANETRTFTVSTTEDAVVEHNETFTVGLSVSDTSLTVRSTDTGTGTINNDDSAAVTINDASADEGDAMTFTVTLDKAVQDGLTVTPNYTNGTAADTDYTKNTTALSFDGTAGETETFTVTTTEDTNAEADETFTVGLGVSKAPSGVTASDTGTGTINNDDKHGITLSASPSSVGEGASGTTVTVTATATAFAAARTVTVAVGKSGDSATEGTDYATVNDFTVTIAANATSGTGTFTLTPTDDTAVEGNETISISGSGTSMTVTGTNVTLADNDSHSVTLSASPSSVGEGASGTTVTVTATATAFAAARTVTVAVGKSGDSATEGTDYATVNDFTVTIAANATSGTGTFTLTPTQDTLVEGNETITVAGSGTSMTVTGTSLALTDDDTAPAVNLTLNPSSVGEGASGTSVTVTAAFSNTSTYGVDKTVTVSVGGSGTATSGTDYAAVSNFDITITKGDYQRYEYVHADADPGYPG